MRLVPFALVVVLAGCKGQDRAECAKVAEPVRAEMGRLERDAKDPAARDYAKKFAPIAAAAIVQSCKDHRWSAAAVAACSRELPLRAATNDCDGALSSEQLAALRKDLGAEKLGGVALWELDVDRAVREVKAGPASPDAATCAAVAIRVRTGGRVVVRRDAEQTLEMAALKTVLEPLGKACAGPVDITADDEVAYQEIVAAMDAAKAAGFGDIAIATDEPPPRPSGPPPRNGVQSAPIVTVTKTAVTLTVGTQEPVALGTIVELDPAKLEDALEKAHQPTSLAILRADAATSARLIKTVVAAMRRAGFVHQLYAVTNR